MSEPRIEISGSAPDVEMSGASAPSEVPPESTENPGTEVGEDADKEADKETDTALEVISKEARFLNYLKSPIVELVIGKGDEQTVLTAHQEILASSPYFAEQVNLFDEAGPRRITLEDESLDAIACFLQYQYTGEYFPKRLPSPSEGLEYDPALPEVDDTGDQLLKHARVYTLAQKLEVDNLKKLAHGKIHRINSSAKGEISYARYVYTHTIPDDITIRRPVAAFWATRSHVLRHEAEDDFKSLCLQYPQFGFDVLNLVLDQKEKRAHDRDVGTPSVKGSARKRARVG